MEFKSLVMFCYYMGYCFCVECIVESIDFDDIKLSDNEYKFQSLQKVLFERRLCLLKCISHRQLNVSGSSIE